MDFSGGYDSHYYMYYVSGVIWGFSEVTADFWVHRVVIREFLGVVKLG